MIHRLAKNPIIRGSALLASGTFVSGALSYVFQVIIARRLSVEAFGDFGALVAISAIASLPLGTITFLVVRATAERIARGDEVRLHAFLRSVMRVVFVCAIVGAVILMAAGGRIMAFFRIVSWPAYVLVMAGLVPAALLAVVRGYVQGLRRFALIATAGFVEVSMKLVIAIVLLAWGLGIVGATGAMLISSSAMLIVFIPWMRPIIHAGAGALIPWRHAFVESTSPFIVFLALTVFLQVDILAVKHWFAPADAGAYNGIVLFGRVVYFLAGAVTSVLVPIAVAQYVTDPLRARRSLLEAMGLVVLCGGGALLIESVASTRIVVLLLSAQFARVAWLLIPYTVAMLMFSIMSLLASFLISTRVRGVAWVLGIGLLVEIIALVLFHESFGVIVGVMSTVFGVIAIVLGILAARTFRAHAGSASSDAVLAVPSLS